MKIRNGFVSNSSSSSFVLFGVKVSPKSLLNNEGFKSQFNDEVIKEQVALNAQWEKKLNHPDFEKHKGIYEMCKSNAVSIPRETKDFFGYHFTGVFEPLKVDEKNLLNEMVMEGGFKFPRGIETLSDDGPTYLGKILAEGEDYLDSGNLSLSDIKKLTEEFINLGFNEEDIKLYYGTRAC